LVLNRDDRPYLYCMRIINRVINLLIWNASTAITGPRVPDGRFIVPRSSGANFHRRTINKNSTCSCSTFFRTLSRVHVVSIEPDRWYSLYALRPIHDQHLFYSFETRQVERITRLRISKVRYWRPNDSRQLPPESSDASHRAPGRLIERKETHVSFR